MTDVERLARFVVARSWDDLSDAARGELKIRLLDALGYALGARGAAPVAAIRAQLEDFSGRPLCTLIGGGASAPDRAALYNGALVRYLTRGRPDAAEPPRRGRRTRGWQPAHLPGADRHPPAATHERRGHSASASAKPRRSANPSSPLSIQLDDATVIDTLTQRRELGRWSADYVLLRGMGRLHVFPQSDSGALNGLKRFLAAAGRDDDSQTALASFAPDAVLVYFHLLLRGLEQQGLLDRSAPN